jgi:sigma-B regulation protein RsbU (phosphoserine phosphatase)
LGGDFWGAKVIDQDRLMLYLVDFSGHGVASALNTIRLHTI